MINRHFYCKKYVLSHKNKRFTKIEGLKNGLVDFRRKNRVIK